ncbi:unnamed protein product, partial [Linum tenue]
LSLIHNSSACVANKNLPKTLPLFRHCLLADLIGERRTRDRLFLSGGTKMGLTNFILTIAGVSAVVLLLRSDVKQSAVILRRNVKHIRTWLEEESAAASKKWLQEPTFYQAIWYPFEVQGHNRIRLGLSLFLGEKWWEEQLFDNLEVI